MDEKLKYRELCRREPTIPLFSQDWWMDAVCGEESWNVFLIERNKEPVATLAYYMKETEQGRLITKPPLTQNNGIWIRYPNANQLKYNSKLDYEEKLIDECIDFLESMDLYKYEQQYHYGFDNWLPFFWRGYSSLVRYTYVIEDTTDLKIIKEQMSSNLRKNIKKAESLVQIKEGMDIDTFYALNSKVFLRQGKPIPYTLDTLRRIDKACQEKDRRKILYAEDKEGRLHAAVYLVWDAMAVYYIMSGSDPALRSSQANSLLLWHGIQKAHAMEKMFDFEGSVIRPIEKAFREFGGRRKAYFRIFKEFSPASV